jgi:uncharacterized membrane protein (DUF106 family)
MTFYGFPDWSVIFMSAVIFSLLTAFISRKTGVKQKTDHIQKAMKEYQNEMNKAVKENNQKKIDELKVREPEVMKMMQEMMWLPFKNMIFVLPLFFVAMWLIQNQFPHFIQNLPIALHLNGNELLGLNVLKTSYYGPRGFFILSSIVSGLVIEQLWTRLTKKKETIPPLK